jgi:hypothetical protein
MRQLLGQTSRVQGDESVVRVASITTAVIALSFRVSACTTSSYARHESKESLAFDNNLHQLAVNNYLNQCDERARLLKHEIAQCRAIPLITARPQ